MSRVALYGLSEILPDCAGGRFCRIRSSHEVAPSSNGSISTQDHENNGALRHECGQAGEKRLLPMHGVESLRLSFGQMHHLQRFDLQAVGFDATNDFSDEVANNSVGLDDR